MCVISKSLLLLHVFLCILNVNSSKPKDGPFTEKCVTGEYPPLPSTVREKIPTFVINLDLPPEERWAELAKDHSTQLKHLISNFKKVLAEWSPAAEKYLLEFVDKEFARLADTLPYPFAGEIRGIAKYSGIPLGEVVLYNIFYEIFSLCTSIVAEDANGELVHARNLDFGLFMGWESKNHSWLVTDALRPNIVQLNFTRQKKNIFQSVNFAGYIGILTAIKPRIFTMTMNERFSLDGGYIGILEWIIGFRSSQWMGFLTRSVMENATSYDEAKAMLTNTPILSPAYFILGGNKSGQASVITRSRNKALDVWDMGTRNASWYILETNYDNWAAPLFVDDRRTPAHKCMDNLTQKNVGFSGIYNVLSSKPMLNKLTTYTALMQVNSGKLETYIRFCPDPCPPW